MKTFIKSLFLLPVLTAGLGLMMLAGPVTAQTFTVLHSFTAGSGSYANTTNSDGASPQAGLILSGNRLYGTTMTGGSSGKGTVFALNTDGNGFTNLYTFAGAGGYNSSHSPTNSDGAAPNGLILSGNTLFGTAQSGGSWGWGTVFALSTDGTGFTNLHTFTGGSDGAFPHAGLILSGSTLFGTSGEGGTGSGSVFALNTDGTGFTNLHTFTATPTYPNWTNSDGANPIGGLILLGNTLYGTAAGGGPWGNGTVFALNTDGTGFTNLHSLAYTDGVNPQAGLVLSGNSDTLYGTAQYGGNAGYDGSSFDFGTVFALNTDGTGFTNLHSFTGGDGISPRAGLILSRDILYGTTGQGGRSDLGAVFAVRTDGTAFTTLHSFTAGSGSYPDTTNSDGANPEAGLTLSGNTLYGTAQDGGTSGNGTIFSLSFQPQLTITPSVSNIILSWPTNVAGFDYTGYTLAFTTNLASPVWTTNLPPPVVVNGQLTVTNPIAATGQFFRLRQ